MVSMPSSSYLSFASLEISENLSQYLLFRHVGPKEENHWISFFFYLT